MYELDLPFVNGLKEFDEIVIMSRILRKCGGFFVNTQNLKSRIYQIMIEELFALMMKKRIMMEYHLERRRERSGKLKKPQEFIFENYINAYLRNVEIDDVLLVPITINYDKVYEGQQFPFELLGEEKPKQSYYKFMKQFLLMLTN
jgi:glycerol-3-phosphate O-acyltransferase